MNLEKLKAAAARRSDFTSSELPAELAAIPAERMLDLDVREDLRRGAEPFGRIMQAQAEVPPGGVLRVRAIFEPAPLYMVLGRQGFTHWTERLADDDWRVWFLRTDPERGLPPHQPLAESDIAGSNQSAAAARVPAPGDEMVVLDVRGLEPPEPMIKTLEALEQLPAGKVLLQINARVPQLLLPILEERGFEYKLMSETVNEVRGLIRPRQ
jgi:hypothetical protein